MFEWDENKSQKCLKERGFDFSVVYDFDFATAVIFKDERKNYGEPRYRAFNMIENRGYFVIFTLRTSKIRIISVRKANKREMKKHGY